MTAQKMHDDEVHTDVALVRALLDEQFPDLARYSIEPVESAGTDNAIYRIGTDFVARLPRIGWAVPQVELEARWLPRLAPHLPLEIPSPVATGAPGAGYPWPWALHRWIAGENIAPDRNHDLDDIARDVARFVRALQAIDPTDGPRPLPRRRGAPLGPRDPDTRDAIARLRADDGIDTDAALRAWDVALAADEWNRAPTWFHGDLLPGNLIVHEGRACAVIDFSGLGVGDPACDVMIAWGLFRGSSRAVFRAEMGVDDATWARGRGHALSQAALFIPYYRDTNPLGVARARHLMAEVLADPQ